MDLCPHPLNTLRPRQNGRRFADDTLKRIFLNENVMISSKFSLKFVPKVRINNIPALVQIMAWRLPGDKPLSEPMMVWLLTHICNTRPQWVKLLTHATHMDIWITPRIMIKYKTHIYVTITFAISFCETKQNQTNEIWINNQANRQKHHHTTWYTMHSVVYPTSKCYSLMIRFHWCKGLIGQIYKQIMVMKDAQYV